MQSRTRRWRLTDWQRYGNSCDGTHCIMFCPLFCQYICSSHCYIEKLKIKHTPSTPLNLGDTQGSKKDYVVKSAGPHIPPSRQPAAGLHLFGLERLHLHQHDALITPNASNGPNLLFKNNYTSLLIFTEISMLYSHLDSSDCHEDLADSVTVCSIIISTIVHPLLIRPIWCTCLDLSYLNPLTSTHPSPDCLCAHAQLSSSFLGLLLLLLLNCLFFQVFHWSLSSSHPGITYCLKKPSE